MQADEEQTLNCAKCRYWTPRFAGLGRCTQEGMPQSLFFIIDGENSKLLTHGSFYCKQYTAPVEIKDATL